MRLFKEIILALIVFWLGLIANLHALNQEWTKPELEVWKIEAKYWECWIKGDIEGYMRLIHENFIGWPSSSTMPSDKKAAKEFVERLLSQTKLFAFEIKPSAIRIIGDVAVVHYFLIWKNEEGNQVGSTYRITHTWKRQDSNWQVIGGVSSEIKTKPSRY